MIVCVGKIVAVNSIVSGPTPSQLVAPSETIVQYQCTVIVQDIPREASGTSWTWLINSTRYTRLSTRFNNGINITESSNSKKDITEIALITDNNNLLQIACRFEVETNNGSKRYISGNTTAILLSFG